MKNLITKTITNMGILNEYVRNKYPNCRSLDPLLSNVLIGENKFLIKKNRETINWRR